MADENLENNQEGDPAPGGNDSQGTSDPVAELTSQLETLRTESTAQLEALRTENETQLEALRTESTTQLEALRAESTTQLEALQTANSQALTAYLNLSRALPGLVSELVQGDSVEAVQASVATAREAFNRIAAGLSSAGSGGPGAGGAARTDAGGLGGEPEPMGSKGFKLIYGAIVNGKSGGLSR